jgi:hypothetical protein
VIHADADGLAQDGDRFVAIRRRSEHVGAGQAHRTETDR